jgi:hypothetical protein
MIIPTRRQKPMVTKSFPFFFESYKLLIIYVADTWTMSNWPVISPEAQHDRDELVSSHRPVPLPAYDINGNLIAPHRCKAMLAGAIARVTFTLTHWFIHSTSKDDSPATNSFVGDIQSIRILVNAPSQLMSPQKRKTATYDPSDKVSGKKKMKQRK